MHGYGYPPEQPTKRRPSQATLTVLRVVFVTLTVLSCGLLAWAAMLRLALVTRKGVDWCLLVLTFTLNAGFFAFMASTPENPDDMTVLQDGIAVTWLLGVIVGGVTYYLYADIRHFGPFGPYGAQYLSRVTTPADMVRYGGYLPPQAPAVTPVAPTPGYGYPPAGLRGPAPQTPVPRPPVPQPSAPPAPVSPPASPSTSPTSPTSSAPTPLPPPPPASPHRLDQVRAELDELSDYLRKEGGNR